MIKHTPAFKVFNLIKSLAAVAVTVVFASQSQAQTFSYNYGDLLIGFRNTLTGTYDLVVDAGPAANFTNLPTGTKITITALTGSLLHDAFGTTNDLSWSVMGAYDLNYSDSSQNGTLFMSSPRFDLNTQSTPWLRNSVSSQDSVGSKIDGVGVGAAKIGQDLPANSDNTPNALVELESWNTDAGKASYYHEIWYPALSIADWDGTFQGVPEQTTSDTFTDDGQPVRADLYWMLPYQGHVSQPPGTYLGYFEFNTNGVLIYTAGPSATVTQPTIVSVIRVGNTTTVYFTTGNGGSYNLLGTNNLSAPLTTWPVLGSPVTGNSQTNSISDVTTDGSRFYLIRAQ